MKKMASQLRSAREKSGITLRALAGKIGITPGHLSRIETGHHVPSETLLRDICKLTGADFYTMMRYRGLVPSEVLQYIVRTPGVLERLRKEMVT